MANYTPVRPQQDQVADIPAVPVKTVIMAYGGTIFISSDAVFDRASALPLVHGQAHTVPANAAWKCACEAGQGAELRRMDLE